MDCLSSKSSTSTEEPEIVTNEENEDVFLEDTDPAAQYLNEFHQGSTPETPTAAPLAFRIMGKLRTLDYTLGGQVPKVLNPQLFVGTDFNAFGRFCGDRI
jgi:hypothetical protein